MALPARNTVSIIEIPSDIIDTECCSSQKTKFIILTELQENDRILAVLF
jgi:hypothetical protein